MRGAPQIEITLDIDANGILKVSAKDKATGKENKITIKANSGLTEAEIEAMVHDAEVNAEADTKARVVVEAKNAAEAQINTVNKNLKEHGDKITAEQKIEIETAITAAEATYTSDDAEAITAAVGKVFEVAKPLFEITQAQESATVEPGAQTETAAQEGVVDAEFTEVDKEAK